ncbi:Nitrogen permease regulator 3 [Lithohypha guttulata]|uniref:Nitrogen permease regulator 3 n=1 Tax=Lithohypha guttulata TaxID=1690604 RepID=UPI002DDF3F17|nr:Nitrogen permease regulator 3 [Lithohypha guttulata]
MSSTSTIPNPCLVAILLVCQTRSGSGPQLVHHWPPDPLSQLSRSRNPADHLHETDEDLSDDSYSWSSDDGDLDPFDRDFSKNTSNTHHTSGIQSDGTRTEPKQLLGLAEDGLISLLTPDRSWNKKKFELSINDLTFVGRPVFARQNGSWRRQKDVDKSQQNLSRLETEQSTDNEAEHDETDGSEGTDKVKAVPTHTKSELTMFHIVFVMDPPPLEHSHRLKEMYDNVVKKFSKALKWVQAHHNYVWNQTELLLSKRQELSRDGEESDATYASESLESSSLAKAITTVYTAIASSRIASISLLPGVSMSMQIRPITSTPYLPSLTDPPILPGVWLTTAVEPPVGSQAGDKPTSRDMVELAKSYTLLLKSPPHRIAKDAQAAGGPMASHLPKFVAALRPTKSFFKLSNDYQISLAHVQLLARHLVYWRRAVAIPPLNQRDTYIVSPNADFRKIREACRSYESQFPASLPSLPKLLGFLSGIPRPFGTLIPSPDHKDIYMLVLAWLMRNGWVTQLRTFAYVRVGNDVKKQARAKERDARTSVSVSQSSDITNETGKAGEASSSQRPSFISRQSSDGRRSLKEPNTKGASLIKSPPRATPEESQWLTYLHDSILNGNGLFSNLNDEERQELHYYWPSLSKHFDGITALETVPVREGLKRKVVWGLYSKLGLNFDDGVEDHEGLNNSIIVTIRHW